MKKLLILIYIGVIIYLIYEAYNNNWFNFQNISKTGTGSLNNILNGSYQQAVNMINGSTICGCDIQAIAENYNIPSNINIVNLVKAIIYQESSGICSAVNPVQAGNSMASYGLMQLTLPVIEAQGYSLSQAENSGVNITIGATYICQLLAQNNFNIENALSMYNSGQLWDTSYANSVLSKYNDLNSSGAAYDANGNAYGAIQCC